jgi:hypothetical protein
MLFLPRAWDVGAMCGSTLDSRLGPRSVGDAKTMVRALKGSQGTQAAAHLRF